LPSVPSAHELAVEDNGVGSDLGRSLDHVGMSARLNPESSGPKNASQVVHGFRLLYGICCEVPALAPML
jgi:hypothetical protein